MLLWQHQFRSRSNDLFSPNKLCFSSIHLHWSLSLYLPDQMSVSPLIQSWKLLADSCTFGFRVYAHKSCRWSTQDRNKILKTAAHYSCLTALSPYEHIIFTFLYFTPSFETELLIHLGCEKYLCVEENSFLPSSLIEVMGLNEKKKWRVNFMLKVHGVLTHQEVFNAEELRRKN